MINIFMCWMNFIAFRLRFLKILLYSFFGYILFPKTLRFLNKFKAL